MPISVAKLRTEMFARYLRSRGWQEKRSRYEDRVYFEGEIHEFGEPYQLYLPSSIEVPRYRTLLQRAVYFLCGVEDREPHEIIRDIFTEHSQTESGRKNSGPRYIRVKNSANSPLRLIMKSRSGELQLRPGECIELLSERSASDIIEIELTATTLIVDDRGPRQS